MGETVRPRRRRGVRRIHRALRGVDEAGGHPGRSGAAPRLRKSSLSFEVASCTVLGSCVSQLKAKGHGLLHSRFLDESCCFVCCFLCHVFSCVCVFPCVCMAAQNKVVCSIPRGVEICCETCNKMIAAAPAERMQSLTL